MTVDEKLGALRTRLGSQGFQAYIIQSSDPHQGEYVADHFQNRAWISGFAGSAGTVVVTQDRAGLWTDSRYWLEAERVLAGTGIQLFKAGDISCPDIPQWLGEVLPRGARVACQGRVTAPASFKEWEAGLGPFAMELVCTEDLTAEDWKDRPALPEGEIRIFQPRGPESSTKERLDRLYDWMLEHNLDWYLVSALDELAWLLNLRGSDVDYNPVFYGWLLLGRHGTTLFVDESRFSPETKASFNALMISFSPYRTLGAFLQTLSPEDRILVSPSSSNMEVRIQASHMNVLDQAGVVARWKARKNEQEIESLAECLIADGAAVVKTLHWVESSVEAGKTLTEHQVGLKVHEFRADCAADYQGPSFAPIVGFGANGAIVHYDPPAQGSATIGGRGLMLLDSGGQYLSGTTDITRVLCLGSPSNEEKRAYTLVLKGHIALSRVQFPQGTSGAQLDVLARMGLWSQGLNYGHGTGHGIGYFLSVHEGPQRIAPNAPNVALEPGMLISNEPGYYKQGAFGIRIENIVAVQTHPALEGFLNFRTLTLAPYAPELMDSSLLNEEERSWLEHYSAEVHKRLKSRLSRQEQAWLAKACKMPWQ